MNLYPNFEAYFKDGFTQFRLPRRQAMMMDEIIRSVTWVKEPSRDYLRVPEDKIESIRAATSSIEKKTNGESHGDDELSLDDFSDGCKQLMRNILDDKTIMGELSKVYDFKIENFYLYNGAEETGWYFDVHENSDLILLIYTTDEARWDKSWGGYFEVGHRSLDENDIRSGFENVEVISTIMPDNRTVLFVSNRNPRIVHRSVQLAEEKNRITLYAGIRFVNKKGDH